MNQELSLTYIISRKISKLILNTLYSGTWLPLLPMWPPRNPPIAPLANGSCVLQINILWISRFRKRTEFVRGYQTHDLGRGGATHWGGQGAVGSAVAHVPATRCSIRWLVWVVLGVGRHVANPTLIEVGILHWHLLQLTSLRFLLLKLPETEWIALIKHDALNDWSISPIVLLITLSIGRIPILLALLYSLQLALDAFERGRLTAVGWVGAGHVRLVGRVV